MYRALCALSSANGSGVREPSTAQMRSGAEIAEIAVCLAAGESCPLVIACPAPGARIVANVSREIRGEGQRLSSATLAAMDALLTRSLNNSPDPQAPRGRKARKTQKARPREEAAIVCAGLLDGGAETERDYCAAFGFAARHKLPILYIVANRPGQSAPLDLRSIYPEFGIPLFTVDANDAIAAYRVATEALHNARHLRGPSVIEALVMPQTSPSASHGLELLTAYMLRHGNPPE